MNQLFLIYKNGKFIWFDLIWCRLQNIARKEQSLTRCSYLRSSFLLIKAFIYSESFFCINANRSQARPLPTGVLQKHRNQTAETGAIVGWIHWLVNGLPVEHACWGAPYNLSNHIPMWGIVCGLEGLRECVWDKCGGKKSITKWDCNLKARPLEGSPENVPLD